MCVSVWERERGRRKRRKFSFPKWGSWPKSLVGQSWEFKKKKFPFLQGVGTEWKHGWHRVCFCLWFSCSQEGYLPPMLEWKMQNLVAHYSLGDGMRTFFAMAGVFLWQTGCFLKRAQSAAVPLHSSVLPGLSRLRCAALVPWSLTVLAQEGQLHEVFCFERKWGPHSLISGRNS